MTEKLEEAVRLCDNVEQACGSSYDYRGMAEEMQNNGANETEIMERMGEHLCKTANQYFADRAENTDKEYEAEAFRNTEATCNVFFSGLGMKVQCHSEEIYEDKTIDKYNAYDFKENDNADFHFSAFVEKVADLSLDNYKDNATRNQKADCKEAQEDFKEKDVYSAIEVCKDIRQAINPELPEEQNTTNYYEVRMENAIEKEATTMESLKYELADLGVSEAETKMQVTVLETLENTIKADIKDYEKENADVDYRSPVAVIGFEKTEDGIALALYNVDEKAEYQVTDGEGIKAVLDSAIEAGRENSAEKTVEEKEVELD